ncbi:hypothetical protein [Acidiphilium sp. C61]|uniref:hypothetical protein n=1 Tax=Acidiphilium sp. C61 TaxID=1671485 RepID=UPI00157AFC00|nr:hypothetical protein [Acidiphilium sp. C61]
MNAITNQGAGYRFNGLPHLEDYLGWREMVRDPQPKGCIGALQGGLLDLLNLRPTDVKVSDICRGLSAIPRYNGQTDCSKWGGVKDRIWTVSDHSVVAFEFAKKLSVILGLPQPRAYLYAAYTLLHDAPEYIIGDIVSPLKELLKPFISKLEDGLARSVHISFGLPAEPDEEMATLIKLADEVMLLVESVAIRPGFEHYEMRITEQSRWLLRNLAFSHPDRIEDLLTVNPRLEISAAEKMVAALDEILAYPLVAQNVVNIADIVSQSDTAEDIPGPSMET